MSTIHSISDTIANAGPYTVIGAPLPERDTQASDGLSIVLFNRGSKPFRRELLDELRKIGAKEILSIESGPCPYDVESLSHRHNRLRFLIFSNPSSPGVRIDAAFREARCNYVFVIHADMEIHAAAISSRVFSRIVDRGYLCTVPVFLDGEARPLPTVLGPMPGRGGSFDVQTSIPGSVESSTLMPWDYSGIYRRDKHIAIGGFDSLITEPWWQKLEYGMRAWLWGEKIAIHPALKVAYTDEPAVEDSSPSAGYRRFFLKTLAVRRHGDFGRLPRSRWWHYMRFSGESASAARDNWHSLRTWVHENRYRFVRDAAELIELWDWSES